jgi:hypothetical protein
MSYWEIKRVLHDLAVRTTAFHQQLMSDHPNWADLRKIHRELCRAERYLQLKENE